MENEVVNFDACVKVSGSEGDVPFFLKKWLKVKEAQRCLTLCKASPQVYFPVLLFQDFNCC